MLIHKKKPPQKGDYRVKKIFALIPHPIDQNTDAWLQYVYRVDNFNSSVGWTHPSLFYYLTQKEAMAYISAKHDYEKDKSSKYKFKVSLS